MLTNILPNIIVDYTTCIFYFLFMALIFSWLKQFKIARLFKEFRYFATLILMFIEGNVQQFTFYFCTEMLILINFKFTNKLMHVFALFFFFLFMMVSLSCYFIIPYIYGKRNWKEFAESMPKSFKTILFLYRKGLHGILLGMAHALLI